MENVEYQIRDILQKFKIEIFHIYIGPEANFVVISTPAKSPPLSAEIKEAIYTVVPPSMFVKFRKINNSKDVGELGRYVEDLQGPPTDNVNHPKHYNQGKIEVIEFIEDQKLSYHLGNTVKYICRAGRKDPDKTIEDLEKAAWYLRRAIETLRADKDERPPIRPNNMVKS